MTVYLSSYIRAYFYKSKPVDAAPLPFQADGFFRLFKEAGAFVKKTDSYYCIVGLSTGGVVKAFSFDGRYFSDCGIAAVYGKGKVSSSTLGGKAWSVYGGRVVIEGPFYKIKTLRPTTAKHIALRVASYASPVILKKLRGRIRAYMLAKGKPVRARLKRTVVFEKDRIEITDEVASAKTLRNVHTLDSFNYRYIPSSQYFNPHDLNSFPMSHPDKRNFKLMKVFDFKEGKASCHES
jgi:hypothetical protein